MATIVSSCCAPRKVLSTITQRARPQAAASATWNLISTERSLWVCADGAMMMKWKENNVNVTRSWNFFAGDYYTCNVITQISPHTALEVNAPSRGKNKKSKRRQKNQRRRSRCRCCCCCWSLRVRDMPGFCTFLAANDLMHIPERAHQQKRSSTKRIFSSKKRGTWRKKCAKRELNAH